MAPDFDEIGHYGGKITFHLATDLQGRLGCQVEFSGSRAARLALIGIYALPQGVPVSSIQLGGSGQPSGPPPFPGAFRS